MSHFSSSWSDWIHHPPEPLFILSDLTLCNSFRLAAWNIAFTHVTRFAPVLCIHWGLKAQQVESLPELSYFQQCQRHCWSKALCQAMPDYITKSRSLLTHWLQQKRQQKVQCEEIRDESHGSLIRHILLFIVLQVHTKSGGLWQVSCAFKEQIAFYSIQVKEMVTE